MRSARSSGRAWSAQRLAGPWDRVARFIRRSTARRLLTSLPGMTRCAQGMVYLVGGGPGDPGLLTVRGAEVLGRAEVVVYDGLVNPDLLRRAPSDARRVAVGRHEGVRTMSQEAVNRLLVEEGGAGRRVVRLKGGDPFVFGRGGEEAAALAAAGVPFEIVPGVSSFHAVPGGAGIPVGLIDGNGLVVSSGQEDPEKGLPAVDWGAVARVPGTKVLLMGMHGLDRITAALMAGGLGAETPVAVVRRGTTEEHATLTATLGDVVWEVARRGFGSPAVVVIGEVVRSREALNWFERRPLFGRRIVLTRAAGRMAGLARGLRECGAEVWEIPAIRQEAPLDGEAAERAVSEVAAYDWIVFTSVAGVEAFVERLMAAHGDLRALGGARLAAVGPATAGRLKELHLRVDAMPAEHVGREVAAAMKRDGDLENLRVLLARAEEADAVLPEALNGLGAMVDDVAFYRTVAEDAERDPDGLGARLTEEGADWVVFTSGSTATHFDARFGLKRLADRHPRLRWASIGPETTKAIRGVAPGLEVALEARPHTAEGLLAGLAAAGGV